MSASCVAASCSQYLPYIVAAVVAVPEVISVVASLLNRSRIGGPVPEELSQIYDPEEYKTSTAYTMANSTFKLLKDIYDLLIFFGFWLVGGFPWLDGVCVGMGFTNDTVTGLLFISIVTIAEQILNTPWSIYNTFVIEEKFGFNKTTPWTFIKDRLKAAALMAIVGLPMFYVVLWFLTKTGPNAWFYVWVFITISQVVLLFLAPVLIIPLFMEMIPLPEGVALLTREDKEMPPFLSGRLFYMMGEQVAGKPAWTTKDSRFAGRSSGATLSICWATATKDQNSSPTWCLADGQPDAGGKVYATCEADLAAVDISERSAKWTFTAAGMEEVETHRKSEIAAGGGSAEPTSTDKEQPLLDLALTSTAANVGSLRKKLLELADRVGYHSANIFVIDGSTRSAHSNAFCTGFGRFRRICLFDTLLGLMSEDEIVSVLGHEIGHDRLYHVHANLAFSICYMFVMFFLLGQFLYSKLIAQAFFIPEPKLYLGVVLFSIVWGVVDFFVSIPLTVLSRSNEYAADRFSVEADKSYGPLLGSALKKLMKESKVNLTPHPFQVFLTYSHPPLDIRLKAIRTHQALMHGSGS